MSLGRRLPKIFMSDTLTRTNTPPRLGQKGLKAGRPRQQKTFQIIIVNRSKENRHGPAVTRDDNGSRRLNFL